MQRLEVSGAVRPIYGSLGVKWLNDLIEKGKAIPTHRTIILPVVLIWV